MKAIIPCIGQGTRFYPHSRFIPTEMFPITGKPVIHHVIDEAVEAGIKDITIVLSEDMKCVEDYLLRSPTLDCVMDLKFIHKKEVIDTGSAILQARHHTPDEFFTVMLADSIFQSSTPCVSELLAVHKRYGTSVINLEREGPNVANSHGIVEGTIVANRIMSIKSIVDKSDGFHTKLTATSRFVLNRNIFHFLDRVTQKNTTISLARAMHMLSGEDSVYGLMSSSKRFSITDPESYRSAVIGYQPRV